MKILLIGMTGEKGGTETFMMNTAKYLSENPSNEISFLNLVGEKLALKDEIIANGWNIISYQVREGLIGLITNNFEADKFFKSHHFDVVHINANVLRTSFWAPAAKRNGVKTVIVHSHNSSYGDRSKAKVLLHQLMRPIDLYNLRKYQTKLLAASDEAGKWMFGKLPFEIIYNGVDTNLYIYSDKDRIVFRDSLDINNSDLVLISVARFNYQKNQPKILRSFKELLSEMPMATLLLVGSGDDNSVKEIQYLIDNLGIRGHVRMLGRRNDVEKLLSVADVMIFPSRFEGTPYSLMEALSSGLSVVASSEAFRSDENITGKLELLSINDNDKQWAKKVIQMWKVNQNTNRLADNKKVLESKYSLLNFKRQLKKYYSM